MRRIWAVFSDRDIEWMLLQHPGPWRVCPLWGEPGCAILDQDGGIVHSPLSTLEAEEAVAAADRLMPLWQKVHFMLRRLFGGLCPWRW